jgi:hypothetical protein
MKVKGMFFVASLAAVLVSTPVIAETLPPLKPGEAIAVMPDGTMVRVTITNPDRLKILKDNSKRIEYCSMFVVDALGFVTLVNTNPHDPMVVCEGAFNPQ